MASYHMSIKSGKKGKAENHSAYITRTGKHAYDKQDLVIAYHGNLPKFANGNPKKFWQAADMFERANGSVYREYVMALPIELNRFERLMIVQEYIQTEIGTKPFEVAIHEPIGSIGGIEQPHVHIMMSDRMPDGIDRPAEQYFRRYNPNNPPKGGCRKDCGAADRTELGEKTKAKRATWANIQNNALEQSGHDARVDSRSYRERGITIPPEKHLGLLGVKNLSPEDKEQINKRRLQEPNFPIQHHWSAR